MDGSHVTATGNLKMDLLHNFFLECGARAGKSRVYEMAPDPMSRAMCGYLLVRGGVHIVAYVKALEKLTGTPVSGLLPIPDVSNKKFPEAMARRRWKGLHTIMWKWCPSDTYTQVGEIWNGPHPEDGMELEVRDEMPPGFPWPEMPHEPQIRAPGEIDPEMLNYYAKKLRLVTDPARGAIHSPDSAPSVGRYSGHRSSDHGPFYPRSRLNLIKFHSASYH